MRSGSACRKSGRNNPSSIPTSAKIKPFAAREKAAGYPRRRKTTSDANMIGAMYWIKSSTMGLSPHAVSGFGFQHGQHALGFRFGCRVRRSGMRIGDHAAHDRNPFDQFGKSLREQEGETDEDQRFCRPLRQPAGVSRLLINPVGSKKERQRGDEYDDRERHQEKCMPDHVDGVANSPGKQIVHDIDADMLVVEQRPRCTDQKNDTEQDPLEFEPGIGRNAEYFAYDGIDGGDKDGHEYEPTERASHQATDRVNGAAQIQENIQFVTSHAPRCVETRRGHLLCGAADSDLIFSSS